MLSFIHRFHGHGSLKYVFKRGETSRSRHFVVRYTPNSRRQVSRIAVVISKKIHKHATKRNRVRRRMYEVVRTSLLPSITGSYDIVFIVTSPEVYAMSQGELTDELHQLFKEANLL